MPCCGMTIVQSSLASQLPFEDFCRMLLGLSEARGAEKKKILGRFIKQWRDRGKMQVCAFPCIRRS